MYLGEEEWGSGQIRAIENGQIGAFIKLLLVKFVNFGHNTSYNARNATKILKILSLVYVYLSSVKQNIAFSCLSTKIFF